MTAVGIARRQYTKTSIQNQMKASGWIYKNLTILGSMTLEEITGAINGQAGVDSTVSPKAVRRLLEAASLTWKASSPNEARLKLQELYTKMLQLQGRIEKQDDLIAAQAEVLESLTRRVTAIVENTPWVSAGAE